MNVFAKILPSSEFIPNNPKLAVLHYSDVLKDKDAKELFKLNFWVRTWTNGIFDYHHYHSNNHEVLGIIKGSATVILGGDAGIVRELKKGDVLVLPAGTGHKKIESTPDFSCVGAYSIDVDYNMKYGRESEYKPSIKQIENLPNPITDPVFGAEGPLLIYWK